MHLHAVLHLKSLTPILRTYSPQKSILFLCISTPVLPSPQKIFYHSIMHLHAVLPSEIIDLKNIPQFYYASPRRTPLRNHWLEEHTPILLCISTPYSPQKSLTWRTYPNSIMHLHAVLPSEIIDLKNIPQFYYASPRRTPLRNHWLEEHTPILLCISTPYSPQKSLTWRTYPNSTMHLHAVLPSEIIDLKNIPQFYYASPRRTPLRNHWL